MSHRASFLRQVVAIIVGATAFASAPARALGGDECAPAWTAEFGSQPGVDNAVSSLAVFDDGGGGGPALHLAGSFLSAGGVAVNRIARWNGTAWTALGAGTNGPVECMLVFDDGSGEGPALFVGGSFTSAGGVPTANIARWNGTSWSALGAGVNGIVHALAIFDDGLGGGPALVVGGAFTSAGGGAASRVAKWDGTSWTALGAGCDGTVRALAVLDDGAGAALFVGGAFANAGGAPASRIATWDGASWSSLGDGVNGLVRALAVFDDGEGDGPSLFVGGEFTSAGALAASRIARWNDGAWSELGSGMNSAVYSLAVVDDGTGGGPALHAGGLFVIANGVVVSRIAKWTGATWSDLAAGTDNAVLAMIGFDDGRGDGAALFAAGWFTNAGGVRALRVSRWNGSAWSALGTGLNGTVRAMAIFDDGLGGGPALFVGGDFTSAGNVSTNNIAKWDGTQWSALGNGMNGIVRALEVFDDGSGGGPALYAAGQFSVAGSTEASFLAKWDGETWTAVGDGTNGWIYALEVFDDGGGGGPALFVGGNFMSAGGVDASRVARWDGTAWSSVGGAAPDGPVYALLAVDAPQLGGPALFMSGFFHDLGVIPANFVARWNGAGWSALGTGTNDWIWALEVFDDGSGSGPSLIAGGYFIFAGGMSAARIAKWNGAEWSTLGSGIAGVAAPRIFSLKVFDDEDGAGPALYAGGIFATAGGVPAANIAKWNGSEWSALGDGVSGGAAPGVQALVVSNDGAALIAGGSFPASPALDSFVARWQGCAEPPCAPADLNCDGFVDGDDLGTLLGQWGDCPGCAADFNGDGVVDGDDLGELLGEWTPIG